MCVCIRVILYGDVREYAYREHYSRCIDILNKMKKNEHVCVWVVHLIQNVKNMLRIFSLASFFHPRSVRKYSVCIPKYLMFESSLYQSITFWWIPRMATIKRNKRSTHTMLWEKSYLHAKESCAHQMLDTWFLSCSANNLEGCTMYAKKR